ARQLRGNFTRGEIRDFHIIEPGNGAAIVAGAAWLGQCEPGTREKCFGILLQAALRGNGENKGCGHDGLPVVADVPILASASTHTENPTAGMAVIEPSPCNSPPYLPPAARGSTLLSL